MRLGRRSRLVLDPDRAYALWAARYPPTPHNPLMRAEQQTVERILDRLRVTAALDLGTGTGRYLALLVRRGVPRVIGADRSAAMLARARQSGPVVRADARHLPFSDATFDLVVASFMVGDVEDLDGWAAEMARLLRPAGTLLYSDFHPSWNAAGWQRTFPLPDGTEAIVRRYARDVDDHERALARAGLRAMECLDVPLLDDSQDPEAAAFRARRGPTPVALVVRACKPADEAMGLTIREALLRQDEEREGP